MKHSFRDPEISPTGRRGIELVGEVVCLWILARMSRDSGIGKMILQC